MFGLSDLPGAIRATYEAQGNQRAYHLVAETLVGLSEQICMAPMEIASAFDYAGEKEPAMLWLERAFEVRDPNLLYLNVLPFSETLRGDPRFEEPQRRMNLPVS